MSIGQFLLSRVWELLALGVLLAGAAFFAAAETAMFSLSGGDLHHLARDRRRTARLVPALMRHPGEVLTTVLLGTDLLHILYFVTSSLLVLHAGKEVRGGQVWAPVLGVTTLLAIVLFGEVLPKTLAFLLARRIAPAAAVVLAGLGRVLGPVQRGLIRGVIEPLMRLVGPARSEATGLETDELASLLEISQKRGLIGRDESQMLQEVLELTDRTAGDIMVPRVDMIAYEVGGTVEGLLERVRADGVTKVPVYEGDLDHVAGLVHAKRALVEPGRPLSELISPVRFVPEAARLERVLGQFQATRTQVAIVVDEYGGTAGLLTLEDILEEVVGDIADRREPRKSPPVQRVGESEWLVDGDLAIHEWADAFPTDLSGARFNTVGGFVTALLGRIPRVGETARYRNVVFTVEGMGRRRVRLLRVRLEGRRQA